MEAPVASRALLEFELAVTGLLDVLNAAPLENVMRSPRKSSDVVHDTVGVLPPFDTVTRAQYPPSTMAVTRRLALIPPAPVNDCSDVTTLVSLPAEHALKAKPTPAIARWIDSFTVPRCAEPRNATKVSVERSSIEYLVGVALGGPTFTISKIIRALTKLAFEQQ